MIMNLYAIKDVYNGFAPPVVMPNHQSAIRWFEDMKIQNPTIGNNEKDFSLHYMGKFDSDKGNITQSDEKYKIHDLREIGDREETEKEA